MDNALLADYLTPTECAAELGINRRTLERWHNPIREKALGPEHPDVGQSLNNLAALYSAQGRYAEAEPLYQRSLAIDEAALGPDHPDVAIDLNNLAELYQDQGKYAEAEPLYQRSLAIREGALGGMLGAARLRSQSTGAFGHRL